MGFSDVSRLTGARIIAPRYRLAPESLWPCQLLEVFEVYRQLVLLQQIDTSRLIVMGEGIK